MGHASGSNEAGAEEATVRFGVFYELQLPKPWDDGAELRLVQEAIEQVVLADRLGIDHAWAVEHHFLDEYSHCSASEVFLSALAAKTERIRVGFGIRQVIPLYNHPARTAEAVGMLDLVSAGRAELGVGESATRMELRGFNISAREKRAMALEAAEQIANMMAMDPYPGYEGQYFSMPCRNVLPKPVQKPHPPMWMACTNRSTIEVAARNGLGALAFSFVDPDEARHWADLYYSIIRSEECVPISHVVNANIAMVAPFSLHHDRQQAIENGIHGFRFFNYAMRALVEKDNVPGRTHLWEDYLAQTTPKAMTRPAPGIGTPQEFGTLVRAYEDSGVDQVIFLQQGGLNRHEDICHSLELFANEVLPPFAEQRAAREARKAEELAPFVKAALARKNWMRPLDDDEIPAVGASVAKAEIYR
jgi:alkanesulfonate monooxygenase SsuD/methylene tetrahydromethanopterin reductase-like flavin-dependent oxidoreductase (luciferase family)